MRALSIAAIVLAAGASRRLGRPKQLIQIAGETLLARAIRIAREAGLSPVTAVIADPALAPIVEAAGGLAVLNPDADEGIAASIRAGVRAVGNTTALGVVLMTCDQVAISADHLGALSALPGSTAASAYAGAIGIPAYFPAADFPDLLRLRGDRGARDLLRDARTVTTEALALDIDTEADLARALQSLQNK